VSCRIDRVAYIPGSSNKFLAEEKRVPSTFFKFHRATVAPVGTGFHSYHIDTFPDHFPFNQYRFSKKSRCFLNLALDPHDLIVAVPAAVHIDILGRNDKDAAMPPEYLTLIDIRRTDMG
jgi:hypothetical protein